jgi:hypothetical protein
MRIYAGESTSEQQHVYACLKSSGRARRLGPARPNSGFYGSQMSGPFGLAAPWAGGFEGRAAGQDSFFTYAAALNLQTGRGRHCLVTGANHPYSPPSELLIDSRGMMAWAVEVPSSGGARAQIGVCESVGRRIVAEGPGIDIGSVRLRGLTLSWMDSGVRQFLALAP